MHPSVRCSAPVSRRAAPSCEAARQSVECGVVPPSNAPRPRCPRRTSRSSPRQGGPLAGGAVRHGGVRRGAHQRGRDREPGRVQSAARGPPSARVGRRGRAGKGVARSWALTWQAVEGCERNVMYELRLILVEGGWRTLTCKVCPTLSAGRHHPLARLVTSGCATRGPLRIATEG
jgi:hypothetical protein